MWPHFVNLLQETWGIFLARQGTTVLGFFTSPIISLVSGGFTMLAIYLLQGKAELRKHWKRGATIALTVAVVVNFTVYFSLLIWSGVHVVYMDHESLAEENLTLRHDVEELRIKGPYERSFVGAFALDNTIMAFAYLRGLPQSIDPHNRCQVKVTTAPENAAVASSLGAIATYVGCYVFPEEGNLDFSPDARAEVSQLPRGLVIIHAAKRNLKADGFLVDLSNTFHVRRTYELPKGSPANLVWIEIGSGSIWRAGP